jgi:hypothetical protein
MQGIENEAHEWTSDYDSEDSNGWSTPDVNNSVETIQKVEKVE